MFVRPPSNGRNSNALRNATFYYLVAQAYLISLRDVLKPQEVGGSHRGTVSKSIERESRKEKLKITSVTPPSRRCHSTADRGNEQFRRLCFRQKQVVSAVDMLGPCEAARYFGNRCCLDS